MAFKAPIVVLLGQSAAALVYVQSTLRLQSTPLRSATVEDQGLHGSNFCFMPIEQLSNEMQWCIHSDAYTITLERRPRVLRVAGAYPGVTTPDITATPSTVEAAAPGT